MNVRLCRETKRAAAPACGAAAHVWICPGRSGQENIELLNDRRKVLFVDRNVGHLEENELVSIHLDAEGQVQIADQLGADFLCDLLREIERDLEQLHVILGTEGMAFADPDYHAMQVFSTLFGGGMSSRLFQEIREQTP